MNEELYVHYQPKVNPKTSKIVGAEALVHWNHPEWGIVSPGEFIPLAEENGFILSEGMLGNLRLMVYTSMGLNLLLMKQSGSYSLQFLI